MIHFSHSVCPRKAAVVHAMFQYMELQEKAKRGLISISVPKSEDDKELHKLSDFEKILTQLTGFEIADMDHLDEYDKEQVWEGLDVRPVTKGEVAMLLNQPMKEALALTELLEPIDEN